MLAAPLQRVLVQVDTYRGVITPRRHPGARRVSGSAEILANRLQRAPGQSLERFGNELELRLRILNAGLVILVPVGPGRHGALLFTFHTRHFIPSTRFHTKPPSA